MLRDGYCYHFLTVQLVTVILLDLWTVPVITKLDSACVYQMSREQVVSAVLLVITISTVGQDACHVIATW